MKTTAVAEGGPGRAEEHDDALAALDVADAEELRPKLALAVELNRLIDAAELTQTAAAARLGVPQPKVSALRHYRLDGIGAEMLMRLIARMGCAVEIAVRPAAEGAAGIRVTRRES